MSWKILEVSSGGDDFVRIGGPDEGLRLLVMIDDEAVDGGLESSTPKTFGLVLCRPCLAFRRNNYLGNRPATPRCTLALS
jgi:hypothetical protein